MRIGEGNVITTSQLSDSYTYLLYKYSSNDISGDNPPKYISVLFVVTIKIIHTITCAVAIAIAIAIAVVIRIIVHH